MRYFGLVAKKSSFSELTPSAKRAGFALLKEDTERKEAGFQWATGKPDFTFSVSFEDPDRVSVIADGVTGSPEAFQASRAGYGAIGGARRAACLEGRRSSLTSMV